MQTAWAALPQRVGVVSQRCAAVKRLPQNNKVAIGRKFTQVRADALHMNTPAQCVHASHARGRADQLEFVLQPQNLDNCKGWSLALQNLKQVKDVLREVTELTALLAEVHNSVSRQTDEEQEGVSAADSRTHTAEPAAGSMPASAAAQSGAGSLHREIADRLALGHDEAQQPVNRSDPAAHAADHSADHGSRPGDSQAGGQHEDPAEDRSLPEAALGDDFEAEELSPLERDVAVATEQVRGMFEHHEISKARGVGHWESPLLAFKVK